jgi:hypothetical protein
VCLPASSALRPLFVRLFPSVPCCRRSSANAPDALRPPLVCFFLSACAGKLSSALRRDVSRRSLLALPCERRVIRTRGVMVTCPGARYQPRLLQWVNPSLESLYCNRGVVWISGLIRRNNHSRSQGDCISALAFCKGRFVYHDISQIC